MNRRFLVVLVVCLALVGLMMSCKNDIEIREEFGPELVSVTFAESSGASRGLSASLEDFNSNIANYYWGYAAKKSAKDTSEMRRGETPDYATSVVWLNVQNSEPAPGLPTNPTPGFSQGYWDFRLCAYKKVNTGTISEPVYDYVLVYQGETKEFLLKSSSTNESGNNLVTVTVNPVSTSGNGTLIIKTTGTDAIKLNKVDEASTYGTNYFPRIISVESMADFPVEYVDTEAETTKATYTADGVFSLPAGSYKVTFAFADSATAPTVNYAKGTIVATVYSNLDTTIKGDLSEMTTSVTIQPELNPELVTYTAVSDYIVPTNDPTTTVTFSSTGVARKVEAKTTAAVTNTIIDDMAATSGTTSGYDQKLKLNLNVETVEATETTATYEIGMTATLTSTSTTVPSDVKTSTSDVSSVAKYVTVTLGIQEGLTEVQAYHDGIAMVDLQGFSLGAGWTVSASVVNDSISVKKVKEGQSDVDITDALDSELGPKDTDNKGFFFYDSTGVVVFITKSFSPYSLSFVKPLPAAFVAEVGGFKYTKLENAIKKAGTSSTVTLLKNITLESAVDFNVQGGILDLAGYTITGIVTASEYGATVKNGTITGTLTASGNSALIKDLTVTGKISIGGTGAVLENCTVTGTGDYAVEVTAGNATIKSGTYKAADNQKILNGNILVKDGNFKGTLALANAPVSLTGGVYEQNVGAYVAEGYECIEVSTGVFKVRKATVVKNVTKVIEYYTLNAAFEAADSGDELLLLNSTEVSSEIAIAAGKTLSIDLNGKVITGTEHAKDKAVFRNAGNLTIIGTTAGSAINADATAVASIEGSTLTVNGGSYSNSYLVDNKGAYLFDVNGTATINGVTLTGIVKGIRAEGSNASVTISDSSANVTPGWGLFAAAYQGELTISGGNYKTTYDKQQQMIDIKEDGKVTINGGSFETVFDGTGDAPALVVFNNEVQTTTGEGDRLIITAGSFKYGGKLGYINGSLHEVVSITGGTFDASSVVVDNGGTGNVLEYSITGGTFHTDPSDYLAEGYTVIENDGWYTVGTWAARIGTQGYQTFLDAWNVESSEDIVLLKNVTLNALVVYQEKSIDLGTHELTLRGHANAGTTGGAIYIDGGANWGHGELTITNGTLNMPGTNFATYGIYNYGTMTLEDVVINSACDTVIYVNGQSGGTAGSTTLDDVTINSTKASSTAFASYALKSFGTTIAPTISIKDSEITGIYNAVMIYACPATIDGCTITATNNDALWISRVAMASGVTAKMTVSGNTTINAGSDYKRIHAQDGNTIEIIEGTYNFDPTSYVAEGYQVADNHDGTWTVSATPAEDHQVLITKTGETDVYKSLVEFRELVNGGNSFSGYTVTLQCDVATGSDWVPIGNSTDNPFSGVFDGANHTISMNYEDTSKEDIALFGVVSNGTVKRLTVTGSVHAGRNVAGIIVKLINNSSAIKLTNHAAVTAERDKCGGVICTTYSYNDTVVVEDCSNYGIVKCLGNNANTQCIAGGIVGFCSQNGKVTITACKNYGTIMCDKVTGSGATNAGSIVGHIAANKIDETEKTVILSGCANVSSGEPSGKMVQKTYTIVEGERVYDKNEESITCLVGYITNPTVITLVVDGTTCTSSGAGTDYPYNSYTPVN